MPQDPVSPSLWAYLLLCAGLGIYVISFAFGSPDADLSHRSATWARIVNSAALVLAALVWWLGEGRSTSLAAYTALLFGGMLCSFIGDLIMAQVLPLPQHVLFGMLFFGVAHVAYLSGYIQAGRTLGLGNAWVWGGGVAGGLAVAVLLWWALIRTPGSDPVLGYGALGYALLLGVMAGTAVGLAIQEARFLVLAVGALLFLVSDAILGNWLFRGNEWFLVGDGVWILYAAGQALIVFSPAALVRP